MRLIFGVGVGIILAVVVWIIDPKEYALPRINRLQNLLGYSLAVLIAIWGLGYNFDFLRPMVESLTK